MFFNTYLRETWVWNKKSNYLNHEHISEVKMGKKKIDPSKYSKLDQMKIQEIRQ